MMSFRCRACGHLHAAEHAGDCVVPHACAVCNAGVSFDPKTGLKKLDPENWEVLADCDDARLTELGLCRAEVKAHQGQAGPARVGRHVAVSAIEGMAIQDKS